MSSYLPMVSYRKASSSCRWAKQETRIVENRMRHWGLIWFTNERGRHTVEFGVITENMPDFCGGLMVYSPFVTQFDEGGGWSNYFCSPGEGEDVPAGFWDDFDEAVFPRAAELGLPEESQAVKYYAQCCIAAAVAGAMCSAGKRGWVGADHTRGHVQQLSRTMVEMGPFPATPLYAMDELNEATSNSWAETSAHRRSVGGFNTSEVSMWREKGSEWYNTNSGNHVLWVTGGIIQDEPRDDEEWVRCGSCDEIFDREIHGDICPECTAENDHYYDDEDECRPLPSTRYVWLPEYDKTTSWAYRSHARRYYWRNG